MWLRGEPGAKGKCGADTFYCKQEGLLRALRVLERKGLQPFMGDEPFGSEVPPGPWGRPVGITAGATAHSSLRVSAEMGPEPPRFEGRSHLGFNTGTD